MAGLSGDAALNLAKSYVRKTLDGAGALKGEKGDKGDTGPQGPVGPQGLQGEQGLPGINGADGSLGEVRVRTGKFNSNGQEIYMQINPPTTNPVFSIDANGKIMCVSADGMSWGVQVCEDLSNNIWRMVNPQGIGQGIKSIDYSQIMGFYYVVGSNGTVYFSEDYENWSFNSMTVSTDNIDSIPEKIINIDGYIYILCDTGELCYVEPRNGTYAQTTGIIHTGAIGLLSLHDCFVFQGSQDHPAGIYNGREEIIKTDSEGNTPAFSKIIFWRDKLVGLVPGGGLFISDARFVEEIITSTWLDISSITFLYSDGIQTYNDIVVDIFTDDGKLYAVGERGMYRIKSDLSTTTMNDRIMSLNIEPSYTFAFSVDNGFLYKGNTNNLYLFTYEEEIIDGTLAVRRIYNALLV